jgi:hypothetical protein
MARHQKGNPATQLALLLYLIEVIPQMCSIHAALPSMYVRFRNIPCYDTIGTCTLCTGKAGSTEAIHLCSGKNATSFNYVIICIGC